MEGERVAVTGTSHALQHRIVGPAPVAWIAAWLSCPQSGAVPGEQYFYGSLQLRKCSVSPWSLPRLRDAGLSAKAPIWSCDLVLRSGPLGIEGTRARQGLVATRPHNDRTAPFLIPRGDMQIFVKEITQRLGAAFFLARWVASLLGTRLRQTI